ncbi:FRG domain-containing protein, partial [Anaerobaca lacustris]
MGFMRTVSLDGWSHFVTTARYLKRETGSLRCQRELSVSDTVFRGHRDAAWHLQTTLDRERPGMSLRQYFDIMARILPCIERHSKRQWPDAEKAIRRLMRVGLPNIYSLREGNSAAAVLSFMAYLRHHGFPSPFLDWTRSPYVAAFFAFESCDLCAQEVAVHTFRESTGWIGESPDTSEVRALGIGPQLLGTSTRHGRQRSEYTLCVEKVSSNPCLDSYIFADHEAAINVPGFRIEGGRELDVSDAENAVTKYTIPAGERNAALASLAEKGITRQRLFTHGVENL